MPRKALIHCLHNRFAALGGAQKLAYPIDISRFLCSVRLVSHLVRRMTHHLPNQQAKNNFFVLIHIHSWNF